MRPPEANGNFRSSGGKDKMYTSADDQPVLNEEIWRAWAHKNKLRQQATARKYKRAGGIALGLLALGAAIYLIAPK